MKTLKAVANGMINLWTGLFLVTLAMAVMVSAWDLLITRDGWIGIARAAMAIVLAVLHVFISLFQ